MALEFAADGREGGAYPFGLTTPAPALRACDGRRCGEDEGRRTKEQDASSVLDWQPMVEAILADLRAGVERGIIVARFHGALVDAIAAVALSVGQPRVALTGGCFQNRLLTERAAKRLERAGFKVSCTGSSRLTTVASVWGRSPWLRHD